MPQENTAANNRVLSEPPLLETSGFCPNCHSIAYFTMDREIGYIKQCPKCGHSEYLNRRPLSFDKQSRQWL